MASPYSLAIVLGATVTAAIPFHTAFALDATEVGVIAQAVAVRIDGQNPGSGVIIKRQANVYTVLTSAHVVATEDEYDVVTPDGQLHELDYSKVKKLPNVDLALVEFKSPKTYNVAEIGDSAAVMAGASIYVSGFPSPTAALTESIWNFSEGKVTANSKRPLADGYALVYNNDTLPGMSGGAVLNTQGKLIAIHGRADAEQTVQKTETIYQKTGFNLGIPINTFLNIAANVSPDLGFVGKTTETTSTTFTSDDLLLQGVNKNRKRDYRNAIQDFGRAIALDPNFADAYYLRGRTNFTLKQYSQAINDLDQAIALDPQSATGSTFSIRGISYFELKQYPSAIQDFNRAITLEPKFALNYSVRGRSHLKLKQYPQAIKDFDRAITLDPNFADNYVYRGRTYFQLGSITRAKKDLQKAAQLYQQQNNQRDAEVVAEILQQL